RAQHEPAAVAASHDEQVVGSERARAPEHEVPSVVGLDGHAVVDLRAVEELQLLDREDERSLRQAPEFARGVVESVHGEPTSFESAAMTAAASLRDRPSRASSSTSAP